MPLKHWGSWRRSIVSAAQWFRAPSQNYPSVPSAQTFMIKIHQGTDRSSRGQHGFYPSSKKVARRWARTKSQVSLDLFETQRVTPCYLYPCRLKQIRIWKILFIFSFSQGLAQLLKLPFRYLLEFCWLDSARIMRSISFWDKCWGLTLWWFHLCPHPSFRKVFLTLQCQLFCQLFALKILQTFKPSCLEFS